MLLELHDLYVCVDGKSIVKGVNLFVGSNELHVIMGPNASGKTTLLASIMGLPRVNVCNGSIFFNNIDITNKSTYERARMGIGLAHQNPPSIRGVKFYDIVKAFLKKYNCQNWSSFTDLLRINDLLKRDLFVGFSGGERKRAELYLVMLQNPRLALLDEPDSGVDIESVNLIADAINYLMSVGSSIILVTHSGLILDKLRNVNKVHLMLDGKICYSGYLHDVLPIVMKFGYKNAVEMLLKQKGD
jgi:Fe-S cluster assembly ATP-binding protein